MQQLYDDAVIVTTLKTLEIIQIQTTEKKFPMPKRFRGVQKSEIIEDAKCPDDNKDVDWSLYAVKNYK